jgi:hypothetical protein
MGISIHYKGKLNNKDFIDPFCEEVKDIADSLEWEYTVINHNLKDNNSLKGLFIQPHQKAELLQFVFDKKGNLRNALHLEYTDKDEDISYFNHIKTQFSPAEIHIAIIKLLRYLKEKYIKNLEVYDEGRFWETNDEKILNEKLEFLNKMMDKLEGILNSIPREKNESAESIANKIERIIKAKLKGNDKDDETSILGSKT